MEVLGYFSAYWLDNSLNLSIMEEIILEDMYILSEGEDNLCNGCVFSSREDCLAFTDDKCMEYDNVIWKEKQT